MKESIENYLIDRALKVNINNPRANRGFSILRSVPDWQDKMGDIVSNAITSINIGFAWSNPEIPSGLAKLTSVLHAIGNYIMETSFNNEATFYEAMHLGSAIIEGVVHEGYIEIYRAEGFSEYNERAPYIIAPTDKWNEIADLVIAEEKGVLAYTLKQRPANIKGMVQPLGYPLIKRWTDSDKVKLFEDKYIDSPFVQSINKLQQTKWKINEAVLEVIESKIDEIMPEKMNIPPGVISKVALNKAYERYKKNPTQTNREKYNHEAKEWEKILVPLQNRARRTEIAITLSKAKELRNWDTFYCLIDCDYRGRIYYREPFMNYQGHDMARGLMSFKDKTELTPEGKVALAIHTANSYNQKFHITEIPSWVENDYVTMMNKEGLDTISVDKFSLNDRIEWFNQNWDMIIITAENGVIQDCEKPFVFLACCLEWDKISIAEENGETAYTTIPTAIDGTCNGYQHSAALAKDKNTGELVALADSDIPYDLYIKVAQELVKLAPNFFNNRNMSYSEIRKSIAKRGTMVRAYSAGAENIAQSMYSDCMQSGMADKYGITQIDCDELAPKLISAIQKVCPGAQKTMKFLQQITEWELGTYEYQDETGKSVTKAKAREYREAAREAQKNYNKNPSEENLLALNKANKKDASITQKLIEGMGNNKLFWETPSGFPVEYAPVKTREIRCKTTIKGVKGGAANQPGRINHIGRENTTIPDRKAASSGISPNVIHSMDASHLTSVVNAFDGPIATIHDSFSCHASKVEELKTIAQDEFVRMYLEDNPLQKLKEAILKENSDKCNIEPPKLGDLDVSQVIGSKYFFS